ncbi:putative protein kinase [Trypanosoma cruzi]|uniref:Protein kinase, putative n=2 Tax=Trypanosoma cruzi TaxID=5693 RepID=Q4DGE6_TRYCC|nr:protein kinase, putative [Trypanosoma cruzi]EAN91605.1 protein kinase, putative [Trypanosoma cruzi]PWV04000.1 putative protein kinase [Trypanosoma cruzi]|eukprot:XP_813456.1 protein kinase [Trypanosoma cruzi strain CL Brener]
MKETRGHCGMRAVAGEDGVRGDASSSLSPCLCDAFCRLDVAEAARLLQCTAATLRRGGALHWRECTLKNVSNSLLCAYIVAPRPTIGAFASQEGSEETACRKLLKITTCAGCAMAEMCLLPAASSSAAADLVREMMSGLPWPPLTAKASRLFWSCSSWRCCLLHRRLMVPAREEEEEGVIGPAACRMAAFSGVEMSVLLSALNINGCEKTRLVLSKRSGEFDARFGVGGDEVREKVYPILLGQLIEVHRANTVRSFIRVEKGRKDDHGEHRDEDVYKGSLLVSPLAMMSRGTAARRTHVVHSLLLLHAVFSIRSLSFSVSVKRCAGEELAAATVSALLRQDAGAADILLSVLARTCETTGSVHFVVFWRAAFLSAANEPSETAAWLLAGLARSIEKHVLVKGAAAGSHFFLAAVDAVFESIVPAMAAILSSFLASVVGDAEHRLRDLCARGFVEVWSAFVRAPPQCVGRMLESFLRDTMLKSNDSEHNTAAARATMTLRKSLEVYYVSVMERRFVMGGECVTAWPSSSAWWPEVAGIDYHEHCVRVLQHIFALSDYVSHADFICLLQRDGMRCGKHPAAFFLEGTEGLCARLFSMQPDEFAREQIIELQRVASQIIAVSAKTICTSPGRDVFAPPFGGSSGQYATTYTRLLYFCLVERMHQLQSLSHPCVQALLRALRSLIVLEKEAYSTAVQLSISITLSCMLPNAAVMGELAGEARAPSRALLSAVRDMNLTPALTPLASSLKDLLDNRVNISSGVGTKGVKDTVKPFIPKLPLAALPLPQYYTSNGAMTVVEAGGVRPTVVVSEPTPLLPPLEITSPSQKLHLGDGFSVITSTSRGQGRMTALDDPASLAEVLLLLCCLLPGRSSGMISQSGLVAAREIAKNQTKRPQLDSVCWNVPLVRVLRKLEEFMRCPANKTSVQFFDELVTREMQTSPVWIGVDVLRRLLLPQPKLLEGIIITRRIGAGSYGSVFAATHSCCDPVSLCQHKLNLVDSAQSLALKMVSINRPEMEDECFALVSCHTEVTALLHLQWHPHICELLFFGCTASHYVLAMPLYEGGSLREWRVMRSGFPVGDKVKEGCFGASRGLVSDSMTHLSGGGILSVCGPIFAQILETVEFMHARGIRHNDLKADNILIESFRVASSSPVTVPNAEEEKKGTRGIYRGTDEPEICVPIAIRICDFGVSELVGEEMVAVRSANKSAADGRACRRAPTRGTEAVQAPERLLLLSATFTDGKCHDEAAPSAASSALPASSGLGHVKRELAADIWACGCLLYELLTGVMLFGGANLGRLFFLAAELQDGRRTLHEVLQPHQKHALDTVGPGVTEFLLRLLAVDPAERPSASEARQLWEQIRKAQGGCRVKCDKKR